MPIGRCTRCLGHKKSTYMGGIYVVCRECDGSGIMMVPVIEQNISSIPIDIKADQTIDELQSYVDQVAEISTNEDKAISNLINKSKSRRLALKDKSSVTKRQAYREKKLKEVLEDKG